MSTFLNDDNIDPTLRTMDPCAQMLAQVRMGGLPTSPPVPSGSTNDDDDDNMGQDGQTPPVNLLPSSISLVSFGNLIKRKVKLSENSTIAFDQFCQNPSPDERTAIMFAHILELVDISRKNEKAELWTIAPDLKAHLTAYRGLNLDGHVMNSMRDSSVKDLPPDEETAQCEDVLSKVRNKATQFRNILKTAITVALDRTHETANVAALANKLLQGTKIKATLQFYIRLAFIRFVMRSYPWLTEETFWLKVDLCLEANSKKCTSKAELDQLYNAIYQQDVQMYGDPADTPYKTVEFNATRTTWQATVRKHSKLVQLNPKNAQLLAAAEAAALVESGPSRKRPRLEVNGEDEEQNDDNND
ncbi:hypothetical protein MVEN_00619400 [Mycena venus]|uniref:Uncharacterized protein n=1 Tax=Mycena venus TaxID=2733690 RepID=A0A8H6YQ06_9AGAR|nr:hypothetical protein MVEN_00619400 [Mycena venus]